MTALSRFHFPQSRRGRSMLLGGVALLVVVAVVIGMIAGSGAEDMREAAASATASATASPTPTLAPPPPLAPTPQVVSPPPEVVIGQVEGAPASLEAVGLEDAVDTGQGITAELSSISAMQASATGPGNIAGPALAMTVRITNGTAAPVRLADVEVALSYTAEEVAASPVDDDAASPLRGTLASGDSAEGTYVFSVPVNQREVVTVTVGLVAGAPLLVFTGAVA